MQKQPLKVYISAGSRRENAKKGGKAAYKKTLSKLSKAQLKCARVWAMHSGGGGGGAGVGAGLRGGGGGR